MRGLTIVACIAACGDGLVPASDALPPDDVVDERVRVDAEFRGDVDMTSVQVIVQHPDSSLALATRFAEDGRMNALVEPGGFVSVLVGNDVLTYAAVQGGEVLQFERWTQDPAITTVRVMVPELPGALSYQLDSPCGQREIFGAHIQPIDVSLGDCGSATDMLVTARGGEADQFVFRDEVLLGGGTITFSGPYAPIERGTITIVSAPAETTAMLAEQSLGHGSDLVMPFRRTAIGIVGGEGSSGLFLPRPAGSTLVTHLETANGPEGTHVIEWQPARRDVAILWPGVPPRRYITPPMFVQSSSSITWEEETSGMIASGVHAELSWLDDNQVRHTWEILTPRFEATEIVLPVLPFDDLHPRPLTMAITRFNSFVIEGGYDRVRRAFRLGRRLDRGMWFTDSDRGRVMYQALD